MVELYREQLKNGRWFLHEHPQGVGSWDLEEIKLLEQETCVIITTADQCMYGLKTWKDDRNVKDAYAKKPTNFMTNAPKIAEELSKRCDGSHQHQNLMEGRAKEAAIYPPELCRAICTGLMKQKNEGLEQIRSLMSVSHLTKIEDTDIDKIETEHTDETGGWKMEAWDDLIGEGLDAREVLKARGKEIGYVEDKKVWTKMPRKEAQRRGIKVVDVRWIDINKGDLNNPIYRSRLVAKEFNDCKDLSIFAATPPLEAMRLLLSEAATERPGKERMEIVVMISDVARAFFEADAKRELCVELPAEAKTAKDEAEDNVPFLKKQSLWDS